MKSLLVAIVFLGLTTMSCTKSQDSLPQSSDSEIQSRKHSGGGGTTTGGGSGISAPSGLSVTSSGGGQVSLQWNAVSGGTSYWVYRDGVVLAIVTNTYFTDVYAGSGTTHTYAVAAVVNSTLGSVSGSITVSA